MLSGLNTEAFNDVIATIYSLQTLLAAHIPSQSLSPWSPSLFQEYPSIDLSNRYFSRKRDSLEPSIPFALGVDPQGLLSHLLQDDLVHTSDNEVQYYQRLAGDSPDEWRYVFTLCNYKIISELNL